MIGEYIKFGYVFLIVEVIVGIFVVWDMLVEFMYFKSWLWKFEII